MPTTGPSAVPLRRDLAVAVGCGLAALVLGQVRFQLPGIPGAITELSGLAILAAAFHLRRAWPTLVVAALVSLLTPPEGSIPSSFAMHAAGTALAWAAARWLERRDLPAPVLGAAWWAFVVAGYYGAVILPVLLVTNAMAGLLPWEGLAARYPALVGSLRWEMLTIATLTSLQMVNIRQAGLRREAASRLHESESRLAGILAAAPVGLAVVRDDRLAWVNGRLAELAGRTPEALAGTRLDALLVRRGGTGWDPASPVAGAVGPSGRAAAELGIVTADGRELVTLAHLAAMPDEPVPTFALSVLDLTERVRLEAQLRRAQKLEALGKVAGGVAHDFGNLLVVLSLSSAEVAAAVEKGRPVGALLARWDEAIGQGRRVVEQLTAFARRQPTSPVEVDLAQVVERMLGVVGTALGQSIELTRQAAPGTPRIQADLGQVEQVIMNLVINARDAIAARERGSREVDLRVGPSDPAQGEPEGGAVLEVTDTGAGMDEAVKGRLFEPFFTTKAEGAGSGLGLATVYGIVEKHGGRITVESAEGLGTTIRVAFPARPQRG